MRPDSRADRNPRHFLLWKEDGSYKSLWVYAWTLTWAHRSNPDEFRVQLTGVPSPLPLNPSGETLLLGYEPSRGIFAAFDPMRHRQFTVGSNSIYVDTSEIGRAEALGLAFDRKLTGEVVVGTRPDQLLAYIESAELLHGSGSDPGLHAEIEAATASATGPPAPPTAATERERIINTVSRLARRGNFRRDVLEAYGSTCAVTGLQLRVVQAAHILPVAAPGSVDEVRNGIALSPTYHIAYDDGLIYLDDSLEMRLNYDRVGELNSMSLQGGLEVFAAPLGPIRLPADSSKRPDVELIEKANMFRSIP